MFPRLTITCTGFDDPEIVRATADRIVFSYIAGYPDSYGFSCGETRQKPGAGSENVTIARAKKVIRLEGAANVIIRTGIHLALALDPDVVAFDLYKENFHLTRDQIAEEIKLRGLSGMIKHSLRRREVIQADPRTRVSP